MNFKSIYTRLYALASGIMLTFFFQTASAQQSVKPLSLNEAISLSIQNSKQLRVSHAKVEQATASLKEANERQLPDVSVSGSYLRLTQPNIDLKLKLGNDNGSGSTTESPKINQAAYGMANVSLPIFAGGLIQAGKESARYLAEAARLDVDKDREDVIQNTIGAYSNLYKAKAAVFLVQENIRQSDERVKEFTNKEQNGLLARNDLLKAELQQSNYQLALMDAENNLKIANLNMDIMLGLPDNTVIQVDSTVFKVDNNIDGRGVAEFEQLAYQNRKDAASLSARERAANAGIKGAKADYFPSLAVTGGYVAAYIPNFITITNAVTAGVGVKYNLSSLWKTDSKVSGAKAQLAEVQANEAKLIDGIHLDVYQSYENYLLSHKKMDTYIKAIEQSEEKLPDYEE